MTVRERGKPRQRLDFWFDQVAPITGDGIYKRVEDGGTARHALLVNPDAAAHQHRKLG